MHNSTTERNKGLRLWAVCFWLLVWQIAAMLTGQEILLASPLQVLRRFFALAASAVFWRAASFSLVRIFSGFLLGLVCAVLLAAFSARFRRMRELAAPLMATLRAIPVASFVIVALIWVPSRSLSTLISFLIVLPLLYGAMLQQLQHTDPKLIEMARLLRMRRGRQLVYLYALPAIPELESSCITAIGLAWKSGVAAELISIPSGSIGERLYTAKVYLMTGDLFAWTLLIVLLSAACARLFVLALRALRRIPERS